MLEFNICVDPYNWARIIYSQQNYENEIIAIF